MSRRTVASSTSPRAPWLGGVLLVVAIVGLVQLYRWWHQPPAVEIDNLKYIQLLRTAVSSEKPAYVDGVERALNLRHQDGQLSDAELTHFQSIIAVARGGEWQDAHRMAVDFEIAQSDRRRSRRADN